MMPVFEPVAYLYKYHNCFGDIVWAADYNWGNRTPLESKPLFAEAQLTARYEQGKRDAAEWISVNDRLPEERTEPYQVVVVCTKKMGGMYKDRGIRRFLQDWAVRSWPQNFTHWMEAMPLPQPLAAAKKGEA